MAITVATSSNSVNTASSTVTLPASVAAGDLIIALIAGDSGAASFTWPSPWVELDDQADSASAHVASIAYLIASGGETSVSVTHTSERTNQIAWRIPAAEWHGTTPPEKTTAAKGSSINPDSTSLSPSWGSAATMWFSLCSWDDSTTPTLSTYPTNYGTAQANNVASSSSARCAGAERTLTAASEDPGSFALSGTETWIAWTVAVRPPAGTLFTQSLTGGLSFSGSIAKQTNKPVSGGLSFSGSIAKQAAKSLAGGLSFSGSIAKRTAKALAGGITPSGVLTTSRVFLKSLAGGLSFSGSLSKQTNKSLTGGLSFAGSIAKRTNKALAGGLSFAGSIAKQTNKALAGGLSFAGSIAKQTNKALAGGLSFAGSIAKQTRKALAGGLSFAGNLATQWFAGGTTYFKSFTADLSFSGSLSTVLSHFRVVDALQTGIGRVRYYWYGRGLRRRD